MARDSTDFVLGVAALAIGWKLGPAIWDIVSACYTRHVEGIE